MQAISFPVVSLLFPGRLHVELFFVWPRSVSVVHLTFPSRLSVAPVVSVFTLKSVNFSLIDHHPSFSYSRLISSAMSAPITPFLLLLLNVFKGRSDLSEWFDQKDQKSPGLSSEQ